MSKGAAISKAIKATREKRKGQNCQVFEIKIDISKVSFEKLRKLEMAFVQAKWIYNYLVSLEKDIKFNSASKTIPVLIFDIATGKCNKVEERILTLGSQIKQAICERFVQNIINLSKAKKKGLKIGALKFKKEVNSIPLKQFGVTYKILDGKTVSIQGIGKLKVSGLHQIAGKDSTNAVLVRRPSGFYLKITAFTDKTKIHQEPKSGKIGIDFGIKDSVVLSNGEKYSWNFEIPNKLKRKQRKLSKKKKGGKNYQKQCQKIKKNYEKYTRKKNDAANQFVASLKQYETVVIQNENIKGWHACMFGKQVQQSILGRIKSRIQSLETSIVIDRFLPTTKMSPVTGKNIEIGLDERIFKDGNFEEDRDIKSAKTILAFGLFDKNLTSKELRGLPAEEITSIFKKFYVFEDKLFPLKQEAPNL